MPAIKISDQVIERIRNHFDIVDVVNQYVTLKRSGRNFFGLCPFHSEKTPSFSVSSDKQIFHCFGCGVGGDLIKFIMNIENLDFMEAIEYLANDAGIELPRNQNPEIKDLQTEKKVTIIEAYTLANKLYNYLLLETVQGKNALNYLLKRGFTRELIETFNIGYAPAKWDTLKKFLLARGYNPDLLEESGLIIQTEDGNTYDRFRNRIIFPIYDMQDRVIAFGGRVLDGSNPKYLNSPETMLFNKSKTLYNINLARKEIRKTRQAVLFEGYIDTISAWKAKIYNSIATLGTSLTIDHAKIIKRYAEEILIGYDSDLAGQQATFRAIDTLQQVGLKVKVLQMPQGLDPDDYIQKHGTEAFKHDILSSPITAISFKLQYMRKDFNLNDQAERLEYLAQALTIIADLQHAIEREHYLKELSDEFQLSLASLKNDMKQIYYDKRKKRDKNRDNLTIQWNNNINNGYHTQRKLYPAYYNAEKNLICLMMNNREIAAKVQQEIGSNFHVEEFAVLATHLYSYYDKGNDIDIRRFIATIKDERYIELATKLAMLDINPNVSEQELNDYVAQVKNHKLDLLIKQKQEEQLRADRNKDYLKSVQIAQEIIELRKQIKWKKK